MNNQLEKLLSNKNNIVVFDIDGVLTETEWPEYYYSIFNDHEKYMLEHLKDFVKNSVYPCKPLSIMVHFIENLNAEIYTLSRVEDGIEVITKINMLNEAYPKIHLNHQLYVFKDEDKYIMLKGLANINLNKQIIFIDDTLSNIIYCKENSIKESVDNIKCFGSSSLWAD